MTAKQNFILKFWVLGWGLGMSALWTAWELFGPWRPRHLTPTYLVVFTAVSLVTWPAFGAWIGLSMWNSTGGNPPPPIWKRWTNRPSGARRRRDGTL